ncbi:methyltransferase domain-containing protein [Sphingobium sp. CAP-1]|uniref:methyltransferase domain-containing protein n=1 Tax=Sphingobium sp. CAP-1 TaxID=2676077 RepID=UPI0012BB2CF2|nr:methyltransferase domain-containing protein [Sphingobium sp. CAP-1]QGP77586.1 methyltransferase domain-containing protein [Sphingobium sp. CAP-1]
MNVTAAKSVEHGVETQHEDVVRAFLSYLGRAPENDEVINFHIRHFPTVAALSDALLRSAEHRTRQDLARNPGKDVFTVDQIEDVRRAFLSGKKEEFQGKVLQLPDWYDLTLDPDGPAYREQILKFWSVITNRQDYNPAQNEDTPEVAQQDFLYRPAFYASGNAQSAGAHLLAIGHVLMRSNLPKGGRVLEYGAGFGQTSLTFARTGAKVDVVDINRAFVRGVNKASRFFKTDLKSHVGTFGINPSGEPHAYDVILFYESFHHCLDAAALVTTMKTLLKPGGCVLMAGEPICRSPIPEIPYSWGIRLDFENIAIMRDRGWMELGYQEPYLFHLFRRAGFKAEFFADANSHWAQVYRFTSLG